ncbi:MAG: nucleotidyltransferase domain-containing protein [Cyanobacteria bacterium J06631_2]
MKFQNIDIPSDKIERFCNRWQIREFALFGSVLREDFNVSSDIDVLVSFDANTIRGLTETTQMQDELEAIFERKVDLIVKAAIERSDNWLRKNNILDSAQVIYAA